MAFIGMLHPVVAKNTNGVYSDGFVCGKATQGSVTPTTYDVKFYGDDALAEQEAGVSDYAISLGLTTLPVKALNVMFGHTVNESTHEVTYATTDAANYTGVGFCVVRIENGVKSYDAHWFYKVEFTEPTDSYTTKGETVTFSGPTINGTAGPNGEKKFREMKTFDSESAATSWLDTQAGITVSA
jgi:phi13 family phage major tail protein